MTLGYSHSIQDQIINCLHRYAHSSHRSGYNIRRILKSVHVNFAYGRIALTLELLGRFGRFLDENDRVTLPFFSYLLRGSLGSKSEVDCIAISKVWTTGMLVAGEGPPHKRAGAPTSSKVILTTGNAGLGPLDLT